MNNYLSMYTPPPQKKTETPTFTSLKKKKTGKSILTHTKQSYDHLHKKLRSFLRQVKFYSHHRLLTSYRKKKKDFSKLYFWVTIISPNYTFELRSSPQIKLLSYDHLSKLNLWATIITGSFGQAVSEKIQMWTRGSALSWACVAHLAFCSEET